MIEALDPALKPHLRNLRILLAAAEDAKTATRSLDPKIAKSKHGPYELTTWLDGIAKNLSPDSPVQLVRDGATRNWIEVAHTDEPVRFAPYLGTLTVAGVYKIHPKGKETYALDGIQSRLFSWEAEAETVPDVVYPYVLRIIRKVSGVEKFELHFLLGQLPDKGRFQSKVRYFGDPFIVTSEDGQIELAPAFTSPFDPQGVS